MPKSYYIHDELKPAFKVGHGLDPRSCYPRCDFCPNNDNHLEDGTVQLGRWWAHAACATDPENLKLSTAQLPKLDYAEFSDRKTFHEQLMAMRMRLHEWKLKCLDELEDLANHRGSLLIRETSSTEYL